MRAPIIYKHYKKKRKTLGWSAAVFYLCNTYGLDQYEVFAACGFNNNRMLDDGS